MNVDKIDLPKLRTKVLTEKITVMVEPELRKSVQDLKEIYGIDTMEVCRKAIREAVREALGRLKRAS